MKKLPFPGGAAEALYALLVLLALAVLVGCLNPQSAAVPRDITPPTGTILINNGDSYTVSTSVTLALSATDDSDSEGMQMRISNAADFAGAGWQSFTPSTVWALQDGDGPKTVYTAFRDAAGNTSETCSDAIDLDTTLPGPPGAPDLADGDDTGLSSSDNITQQTSALTFSGTVGEDATTIHLYDSTLGLLGSAAVNQGAWTLELSLAEGDYLLFARAEDAVGLSPSSASVALVVDTTAPAAAPGLLKPAPGENTGSNKRPLFTWSALAESAVYELQADESPDFSSPDYYWTSLTGTSHTPNSDLASSSAVPVGTRYYLRMRALDAAGNIGPWSSHGADPPLRYVNVGRFDNDFNGDGCADLVVGTTFYGGYTGRTFIYHGGAALDPGADLTLTGEAAGDNFGMSVASAGDVNGDGYADALVGASEYGSAQGRAYLFYGGSTMDNLADVTITGPAANSWFGYSVSSAGDLNADGYADLIVGASRYNSYQGRVYVYHGGPSLTALDPPSSLVLSGEGSGNQFAWSVASAGDMDGDGYPELIVGARNYDGSRGRAYLFRGGPAMPTVPHRILEGAAGVNLFGHSVASAGDTDGNGYADAIVAAPGYNGNRGRVYLFRGGPSFDATADLFLDGEATGDASRFGWSVAGAGDVDRDGHGDVLVGAHYYSGAEGKAYLFRGGPSMDNVADLAMYGAGSLAGYFGYSVAAAGDADGDGFADLLVGAYGENSVNGRAYLFRGGASLDPTSDLTLSGNGYFGWSVASIPSGGP